MAILENNFLKLSKEELVLLKKYSELTLIPNQEGVFLLIDKNKLSENEGKEVCITVPQKEILDEEAQQVIGLIRKGKLSELVEGKFEEKLNEKQKTALKELIDMGKIFVFKLNETYKKGVYRVKDEEEANKELKLEQTFDAIEKQLHEYDLDKDGFVVVNNQNKARELSQIHESQIKEGLLKGIKSFDGYYYLIKNEILEYYIKKAVITLNEKEEQLIEELAKNINASKILTKIICEFLKEDGEIIEKKKGTYKYVK